MWYLIKSFKAFTKAGSFLASLISCINLDQFGLFLLVITGNNVRLVFKTFAKVLKLSHGALRLPFAAGALSTQEKEGID